MPSKLGMTPSGSDSRLAAGPTVALAVLAGPIGVLVGRRRDGVPPWVFPSGKAEPGESPAQAAVRECLEETGLHVRAEHEIGRTDHPATGRHVTYVACTLTTAAGVRTPPSTELVELRWLDRDQVEILMPDLHYSVCRYLRLRYILHTTRHGSR